MEHPFLDVHKIKKELTLDEIGAKIGELTKKLSFAYRTGNSPLIHQLHMALETYKRAHMEIIEEKFKPADGEGKDPRDNIDIS